MPTNHIKQRTAVNGRNSLLFTATTLLLLTLALRLGFLANRRLLYFLTTFVALFVQNVPFLLLGSLAAAAIAHLLPPRLNTWERWTRPRLIFGALLLGLLLPVGESGAIPVAQRLQRQGVPSLMLLTFLLVAPVFSLLTVAATALSFGTRLLLLRLLFTILIALAIALALRHIAPPLATEAVTTAAPQPSLLWAILAQAGTTFFDFATYMVAGCLLAAAAQTLWPIAAVRPLATNPVTAVLVYGWLGFASGTNAATDVAQAASILHNLPLGPTLAYLTLGSLLDINSLTLLASVLSGRSLAKLLVFTVFLTLGAAIALSLVY